MFSKISFRLNPTLKIPGLDEEDLDFSSREKKEREKRKAETESKLARLLGTGSQGETGTGSDIDEDSDAYTAKILDEAFSSRAKSGASSKKQKTQLELCKNLLTSQVLRDGYIKFADDIERVYAPQFGGISQKVINLVIPAVVLDGHCAGYQYYLIGSYLNSKEKVFRVIGSIENVSRADAVKARRIIEDIASIPSLREIEYSKQSDLSASDIQSGAAGGRKSVLVDLPSNPQKPSYAFDTTVGVIVVDNENSRPLGYVGRGRRERMPSKKEPKYRVVSTKFDKNANFLADKYMLERMIESFKKNKQNYEYRARRGLAQGSITQQDVARAVYEDMIKNIVLLLKDRTSENNELYTYVLEELDKMDREAIASKSQNVRSQIVSAKSTLQELMSKSKLEVRSSRSK